MRYLRSKITSSRKYLQSLVFSLGLVVLTTLMLPFPAIATSLYEIPSVAPGEKTWVIDPAKAISAINEGKIGSELEKLAETTGNEVRFVAIRRLDYGETAQSFTDKLFEQWFPTPEAQANQTLVVLDTLSSGTGIRVGDKAKSLLTDDIAKSVVTQTILYPLREGEKYNQAFLDASDRLVAVLSGAPDPGAPEQLATDVAVESTYKNTEETKSSNATIWVIGFLVAATIIPMVTYYFYIK
ncbi:MAG: hypothetical protein CLLPBCKN_003490 [Chroococcidiopsis cubana SAG 39.79]|jgi:uncharacterized protein|uniref:TPM domain-containing protein n=2 Tax=Chroococcidiopsis TaxID=54298 RepID=K9TXV2_CHRTP|nr:MULTISPECIES: TPM domain-containing protein [Chroococcidiopsis]PSB49320.1 beta-propeller domain-containing protein, methanol dehydrogenase [Cyanosarcina cf. burmensis CCALA 770]AFY86809.1 protein of unknown function DUF477 [Chroococcidiopsis thermalis PCC 7203]MDZ4874094.1 hypothetical protein [Chroococcidiopsis cubana SAG 39.79]PSB64976.1 beta-propeller domain-containing protein, methanol dehydrogenase [Chroococcidiopsis cubana CCALA 043]RUT12245.1 hypothetical protein DSM107010_24590 [Chr